MNGFFRATRANDKRPAVGSRASHLARGYRPECAQLGKGFHPAMDEKMESTPQAPNKVPGSSERNRVVGLKHMNDLSLPIRGERVSIRHLEEHDLANWYALETDPEVKHYVGGAVRYSVDEFISHGHETLTAGAGPLIIELNEDGSFVGKASLAKNALKTTSQPLGKNEWEIQVLIARKYWGPGFGEEVVNELIRAAFALEEITSVIAVVHPENAASRKLMDKLSFQHDDQKSSPGRWDDNHMVFRFTKPK
jgi:[ribosomal protein S5]-alanine N-acetyltransferase